MKRILQLSFLLAIGISGFSQTADLVVRADYGQRFTLFVNDIRQNNTPSDYVLVQGIGRETVAVSLLTHGGVRISRTLNLNKGYESIYVLKKNASGRFNLVFEGENPAGNEFVYEEEYNEEDANDNHGYETYEPSNGGVYIGGDGVHISFPHRCGTRPNDVSRYPDFVENGTFVGRPDLTRTHFDRMIRRAQYMNFVQRKKFLNQELQAHAFTVNQVKTMLRQIPNQNDRICFAGKAYTRTYNTENYDVVFDVFRNPTHRNTLRNFIEDENRKHQTNEEYTYCDHSHGEEYYLESRAVNTMNEADFNEGLSLIESESFSSNKMMMANHMLQNNYMSLSQVRRIINAFSFDSDRLAFAKKAYDKCIDQNMYYTLTQLFTFDSTKKELMEYISQ